MLLIERESQLAALHQYADEANHAQGRLVLVSGEAGIGATRGLCSAVGGCSLALGGM
jgi:predicted ATPase